MRHLLVFGERDEAEQAAETVGEWHPELGVPAVVRETLAGEDDADDAQWLVVLEDPEASLTGEQLARIDALLDEAEGWREAG